MEEVLQKQTLRRELLEKAATLSALHLAQSDEEILRQVLQLPQYKRSKTVFTYVSVRHEVDTRRLIQQAFADGKQVAVPLCFGQGKMEARGITSFGQLYPAAFGLLEPEQTAPLLPPQSIDLIIVPCVACNEQGRRLGYGGGFYDRYLTQRKGWDIVCLCREEFILEEIPVQKHDIAMPYVVSETRIFCTK